MCPDIILLQGQRGLKTEGVEGQNRAAAGAERGTLWSNHFLLLYRLLSSRSSAVCLFQTLL